MTDVSGTFAQLQTRCGPMGPVSDEVARAHGRGSGRQGARRAADRSEHLIRSPEGEPDLRSRIAHTMPGAVGDQVDARGLRIWMPDLTVRGLGSLPEHQRHHVRRRDAVDHAVVDLREQGPAVLLEPLDHPDLPERLRAIQVLGEDPGGGRAQLCLGAGRRNSAVAQVVVDVEVRVVDPDRLAHAEGHEADLLAIARGQIQLALHHRSELLERRRRSLEDADAADVHRGHVVLDVEEHRVLRAHRLDAATSVSVEEAFQLPVDVHVHRHAAVAPLHLDAFGVGIQARPPVHDPVAAGVDRERGHLRVEGLFEEGPELGAAGPVAAAGREHARRTQVAEAGDGSHRAQHRG